MTASRPPLLVRPHYVPKPWGGRKLAEVLGRTDLPEGAVGESWEVADTDAVQSLIDGGPHDGRRLREVWGRPFPLLLKVLDARESLSVQLHPDGTDGTPVKEEAWVGLADGARVALGSFAGAALPRAGQWVESMRTIPLSGCRKDAPPTLVHVPPGTVHAILGGSLLFEVQNPVDVTWRLDDYGRRGLDGAPRALHLEEAGALLARPPAPCLSERPSAVELIGQRFRIWLLEPGDTNLGPSDEARAAFFLDGGRVRTPDGAGFEVPRARTVILPPRSIGLQSSGWTIRVEALAARDAGPSGG